MEFWILKLHFYPEEFSLWLKLSVIFWHYYFVNARGYKKEDEDCLSYVSSKAMELEEEMQPSMLYLNIFYKFKILVSDRKEIRKFK